MERSFTKSSSWGLGVDVVTGRKRTLKDVKKKKRKYWSENTVLKFEGSSHYTMVYTLYCHKCLAITPTATLCSEVLFLLLFCATGVIYRFCGGPVAELQFPKLHNCWYLFFFWLFNNCDGLSLAHFLSPGQSRASLIPAKHPRHPKTSDDTLNSETEGFNPGAKATPPPLPKKSVPRANTEQSLTREPMTRRPRGEVKPSGASLSVANPLYDLDSTWETASQSSSLSFDARQLDESGDSLERSAAGGRSLSRSANSSTAPDQERQGCRSTESLAANKTHRLALYRGLESWEEVAGRIRGLHADTLRKLAGRCEDRFMAGQKDHLRFGTDSWSHFRLTTGKPCCEAEDAVYYTAAYAKDPLINYAVKVVRSASVDPAESIFNIKSCIICVTQPSVLKGIKDCL